MSLYAIQYFNLVTEERGVYKLNASNEEDARRQFTMLFGHFVRIDAVSVDCEE